MKNPPFVGEAVFNVVNKFELSDIEFDRAIVIKLKEVLD